MSAAALAPRLWMGKQSASPGLRAHWRRFLWRMVISNTGRLAGPEPLRATLALQLGSACQDLRRSVNCGKSGEITGKLRPGSPRHLLLQGSFPFKENGTALTS